MTERVQADRLNQVAAFLPRELRRRIETLPPQAREEVEELRLRIGHPLFVLYPHVETPLEGTSVDRSTLETVLELASGSSVHTVMDQLRQGYISLPGGHRMGLCGTGAVENGELRTLRRVSSISLRVAREIKGIAGPILPKLWGERDLESTLILSPPGGGKTTLLRDMIRCLSAGEGCPPRRVGVADERGELAAMWDGLPGLDLGPRCDILDRCPKALALTALLRGMNPQVLAADEITAASDTAAFREAAGCGVSLLATAHAGSMEDLLRRPIYRELLSDQIFSRLVWVRNCRGDRSYTVTDPAGEPL